MASKAQALLKIERTPGTSDSYTIVAALACIGPGCDGNVASGSGAAQTNAHAVAEWLRAHALPRFVGELTPPVFSFLTNASASAQLPFIALVVVWCPHGTHPGQRSDATTLAFIDAVRTLSHTSPSAPSPLGPSMLGRFTFGVVDGSRFPGFVAQFGLPLHSEGALSIDALHERFAALRAEALPGPISGGHGGGSTSRSRSWTHTIEGCPAPQLLVVDANKQSGPVYWLDPSVREVEDMATFLTGIAMGLEPSMRSPTAGAGGGGSRGGIAGARDSLLAHLKKVRARLSVGLRAVYTAFLQVVSSILTPPPVIQSRSASGPLTVASIRVDAVLLSTLATLVIGGLLLCVCWGEHRRRGLGRGGRRRR